jgi:hypothetical protein
MGLMLHRMRMNYTIMVGYCHMQFRSLAVPRAVGRRSVAPSLAPSSPTRRHVCRAPPTPDSAAAVRGAFRLWGRVQVSAGAVVPTFAPENMKILFRQRVTSWDVCAQVRCCSPLTLPPCGRWPPHTRLCRPTPAPQAMRVCP